MKNYSHGIYFILFTIIGLALCWWGFFTTEIPSLVLCFIISTVLILHIPLFFMENFKKYRIGLLLFVLAVATGFYGFKFLAYKEYSNTNALYSTFRLFLLDVDPVFTDKESKMTNLPLAIELARWSAAAYTISTVFSLIYLVFSQSIKLVWYGLTRKHIVISGYHEKVKTLIENLSLEKRKVVLLTGEISESDKSYLKEKGVITLIGKQGEQSLYKRARLLKAQYFLIFHDDDTKNLDEVLDLSDYINNKGHKSRLKQVLLHLSYNQSFELFEEIERQLIVEGNPSSLLSIKTFNVERLRAEKLYNEHPLYLGYEEELRKANGKPLHLLMVGFGKTGQQLALQAMERSHFINSKPLAITVLDHQAKKVQKQWYDNYPHSDKVAKLNFIEKDIEIESIDEFVLNSDVEFTHVFVCLKDDQQDIQEGMNLAKTIPHIPVYLKVSNQAKISQWLHHNADKYANLHLFGNYNDVLNADYVINNHLEILAQKVHEGYVAKKEKETKEPQPTWSELTTFLKESNRNLFNHAQTKLMLLRLKAVPQEQAEKEGLRKLLSDEYTSLAMDRLEVLAEVEHRRWNAFYYLKGWDVLLDVKKAHSKDPVNKLHGCLVSYDELDKVGKMAGEDFKKYDRENVLSIFSAMEDVGYWIVEENK